MLVIGVDCAPPRFVFGPDRFDLPNLQALADNGCWGPLRSCHPPITVPAWAVMTSGKDPGTLGLYGFRNRRDYSYGSMYTADSRDIKEPRVWDVLSQAGKKVVVLGVPQTYPPRPVNGWLVSGFLAPGNQSDFTYPKPLKKELEQQVGPFILDVENFRTEDKAGLIEQLHRLLDNRFETARYLVDAKPWDFFMMVELGLDRLHHGFWKYADPQHPKFEPDNRFRDVFGEYYAALDRHVGKLLDNIGDETAVLVVSDHGAKAMHGGVCVNQWLMEQGLLTVHDVPESGIRRIEDCSIDWQRTKVWSSGGYYARLFFNVAGREPAGTVPMAEYDRFRDEMVRRVESMTDIDGKPLGNKAYKPEQLYRRVRGIPPDLLVYFSDLGRRSIGSLGFDTIYPAENDTGPDDANHDHYGIFIMDDKTGRCRGERRELRLEDVASTILKLSGVPGPDNMQGRPVV